MKYRLIIKSELCVFDFISFLYKGCIIAQFKRKSEYVKNKKIGTCICYKLYILEYVMYVIFCI